MPVIQEPIDARDAAADKHLHLKLNAWERDQLALLSREECVPMTTVVRRIVREKLFAMQKR